MTQGMNATVPKNALCSIFLHSFKILYILLVIFAMSGARLSGLLALALTSFMIMAEFPNLSLPHLFIHKIQ